MKAGFRDQRVAIQSVTPSRDASGAVTSRSWSTLATVWAGVDPISGGEHLVAGQVQAKTRYKVTIEYYSALTTAHRLQLADGTNLDINSIENKRMRNVFQEIIATESS